MTCRRHSTVQCCRILEDLCEMVTTACKLKHKYECCTATPTFKIRCYHKSIKSAQPSAAAYCISLGSLNFVPVLQNQLSKHEQYQVHTSDQTSNQDLPRRHSSWYDVDASSSRSRANLAPGLFIFELIVMHDVNSYVQRISRARVLTRANFAQTSIWRGISPLASHKTKWWITQTNGYTWLLTSNDSLQMLLYSSDMQSSVGWNEKIPELHFEPQHSIHRFRWH